MTLNNILYVTGIFKIQCRKLFNMALITMEPKTNESFASIVWLLLYIIYKKSTAV